MKANLVRLLVAFSTAIPTLAVALPDLVVKKIRLVKDCKIEITIANRGRTGVPAAGYHRTRGVAIQMYKGAKPWGGIRLFAVDPSRKLMQPRSTVRFIWFPNAANLNLGQGIHLLKVTVDNNNAVRESNEGNNTRVKRVKCRQRGGRGRPDLVIRNILLDRKCNVVVQVRNIGRGKVPNRVWTVHKPTSSSVYLTINGRGWGGATIWKFNPSKSLQPAGGGATYRSTLKVTGTAAVKATIDHTKQVAESNESNNAMTKRLSCRKPGKLPDLGMYGFLKIGKFKKLVKWNGTVVLTKQDARLISGGKPAFDIFYSYREYNGVAASGFANKIFLNGKLVSQQTNQSVGAKQIKPIHTQAYLAKSGRLQIKVDADNNVNESRENNNFHFYVNIILKGF